jgi:hypothetical protein
MFTEGELLADDLYKIKTNTERSKKKKDFYDECH